MNDTSTLKARATLLQEHLEQAGLRLARYRALKIVAQLDGYRSYGAARSGKAHAPAKGALALFAKNTPKEFVQSDYLRAGGRHCPYCGHGRIHDALNSSGEGLGWDLLMGCSACRRRWWASFARSHVCGIGVTDAEDEVFRGGDDRCPDCNAATEQLCYGTVVASNDTVQQCMQCMKCMFRFSFQHRLAALHEDDSCVEAAD